MRKQSDEDIDNKHFAFWQCFRLIFALFSLYLMGDVFYRWDAFKFHSSLSEYLPNVALALIIWSIVAFLFSVLIWLPLKIFERVCNYSGLKIKMEHLILYSCILISLAALSWIGKKAIWSDIQTSQQLKLTVVVFISGVALLLTWILRNMSGSLVHTIQVRITPLIWLFTICGMLSLPFAGYYMWGGNPEEVTSRGISTSPGSSTDKKRPNILLVTFDALTARDMSVYGYSRKTTPFMEKWAKTASLFIRTYAGSNYTAATVPGLLTGKRTWTHRKYHHDLAARPIRINTENIALLLRENGYYIATFIANDVIPVKTLGISDSVDAAPLVTEFSKPASIEGIIEKYLYLWFADKFSTYNWLGQDDFVFTVLLRKIDKKVYTTEFPPELAFNKFLEMMDAGPREPFFAWIHVMPPHEPQLPPPPFAGTFNQSMELRGQDRLHVFNAEIVRYDSAKLPWPEDVKRRVRLLRDYYDEFILYCDKQFENFINELQKRNWTKNTIIIVSSDHGDSFEHDYYLHKPTDLYEQVTHIPLIIKEPGQNEGLIIDNIVEQIDIPATILDLTDIPGPSWMEGRSLLPLLRNEQLPAQTAISMSLYKNVPSDLISKGVIAAWEGDYKLVHYLDNKKSLLFNLKKDPDELTNLFNDEPVTGQRLLTLIQNNLKIANEKIMAER